DYDIPLAFSVVVGQRPLSACLGWCAADERLRHFLDVAASLREVLGPASAAIGEIDSCHECRDDLTELAKQERRVRAHFVERMREHPEQQRFVRLSGPEQSD